MTLISREPWWLEPPKPGQKEQDLHWGYLEIYADGRTVFVDQRPTDDEDNVGVDDGSGSAAFSIAADEPWGSPTAEGSTPVPPSTAITVTESEEPSAASRP